VFVQADAARLPFADGAFNFVVSNHSLEHFEDLPGTLAEIGRVVRPQGALFVTVPDASTFCDKLYRWLARGGGHVNAFTSSTNLATMINRGTGLRHVTTRTLFTSLSFLNRRNSRSQRPRRLAFIGGGHEWSLFLFALISRSIDRRAGTRLSVYGWALYFGNISIGIDASSSLNVCLRCGAGTPSVLLKEKRLVSRRFRWFDVYRCPQCGAKNPFVEDPH